MSRRPEIGEFAPDFTLEDETGRLRSLKEFAGKKNLVLYFYPKDFTSGCTAESCLFRDRYDQFVTEETEVLGVSRDDRESHEAFKISLNLPFSLLADVEGKCHEAYGIEKSLGGLMKDRVTFVISKEGKIIEVHDSVLRPNSHISAALKALR